MKRLHISIAVDELDKSIEFYQTLFGSPPTLLKPDYAKWMLDDPRVNFVLDRRAGKAGGVHHLGIQTDSKPELEEVSSRLKSAAAPMIEEQAANCCYALSDKTWSQDPQGVVWETFYTFGNSTVYGNDVGGTVRLDAIADERGEGVTRDPTSSCCGDD